VVCSRRRRVVATPSHRGGPAVAGEFPAERWISVDALLVRLRACLFDRDFERPIGHDHPSRRGSPARHYPSPPDAPIHCSHHRPTDCIFKGGAASGIPAELSAGLKRERPSRGGAVTGSTASTAGRSPRSSTTCRGGEVAPAPSRKGARHRLIAFSQAGRTPTREAYGTIAWVQDKGRAGSRRCGFIEVTWTRADVKGRGNQVVSFD